MTTSLPAPAPAYPVGIRRWIIVLTAVTAAIMELIDTSIVNVGLTDIAGSLGATIEDAAWVVTSYGIANVIVIPMTGFLQRYFGRKNYYIASIILFTLASYGCGVAPDLWTLVFFRFLQGVGGGALLSTSQGLMFDAFPPKQRAVASALFGLGIVLGPTFGPTLGGYIIDNFHWSWMFYINIPVGIAATFLSLSFIDKKADEYDIDRKAISIDWTGILLLAVSVGSLQYVLERGESDDWFDDEVIRYLTGAVILALPLFIWWQLRGTKSPVLDLRVLKNRNLAIGSVLMFIVGYGLFTSVLLYPLMVQRVAGFTATKTGQLLIPGGAIAAICFPLVGRILSKGVSPRYVVMAGYVFFAAFCFLMSTYTADTTDGYYIQALLIRGVGLAFVNVPLINSSVSGLKPQELPAGISFTNMMRQLGGAFGVAITNTYVAQRVAYHRVGLVSNITPDNPLATDRINGMTQTLTAKGMNALDAVGGAYRTLELAVQKQSLLLAYLDTFRLAGLFFVVSFPLLFLLRSVKMDAATAKAAADAAH
ncbi:DHA2 family efflux MFS transporter permease subunit [Fibrella sp. HMF5335]|uniref:DHA2 family efflux MFS transporter permease subunit n=1 Tax=Fibrella rubiginis TaxID=2817060 RepID=A0A939GE43_9BACT|nr:DHA2 family efflux MFS transporter permease subunit [Fibrella rubiginis]MBO0937422.1 DHA2 family efflux MFS transporter permease subunit [Fibrella rubiginis]